MLKSENLFSKMIQYFPRWMDFRKRPTSSVGGQFIKNIADNVSNIQSAIDEYQAEFFIETYKGIEETIPSLLYRLQVGSINIDNIKFEDLDLEYTSDIKTFYTSLKYYYYENDFIYFRYEAIKDPKIKYSIDTHNFSSTLKEYQIWNIFDEFAMYVGLTRLEKESNLDLEKRILYVFKDAMDGTKNGLKHALHTELLNLDPELKLDEIKIEGITQENALKKYNDKQIIDIAAEVNKDCYQYKKWDIDPWFYDINSIAYLPHQWDKKLPAVQDGIGKDNDLKIELSTADENTVANIQMYEKNEEKLNNYLETNQYTVDQTLSLVSFSNELKPINVEYQIEATQAIDITNDNISFVCNNYQYINDEQNIIDYASSIQNVSLKENVTILDPGIYKIQLTPKNNYGDMSINKINFIDYNERNNTFDMMEETDNYQFDNNRLILKGFNKNINSIYESFSYKNMKDSKDGMTISDENEIGTIVFDITDYKDQPYHIFYDCKYAQMSNNFISLYNFEERDNQYYSLINQDSQFIINCNANNISFEVQGSQTRVFVEKNGEILFDEIITDDNFIYTDKEFNKIPQDYNIQIIPIDKTKTVKICNVLYTFFNIMESIDNNLLTIEMSAYTEYAPEIRSIYIGEINDNNVYVTNSFGIPDGQKFFVSANADNYQIDILKVTIDEYEDIIPYIKDYKCPYTIYHSETLNGIINLDLSEFSTINSIQCGNNTIETYLTSSGLKYRIIMDHDNDISVFKIEGIKYFNSLSYDLCTLFDIHSENDEKLYIADNINGFIKVDKNGQYLVNIHDNEEIKEKFKNGIFDFIIPDENKNKMINRIYLNNGIQKVTNNKYDGIITAAYLKPKDNNKYIAYNKQTMYQDSKKQIEIEENFSPLLETNKLYCYKIIPFDSNNKILFYYNDQCKITNNFSIGKNNILIEIALDYKNTNSYYNTSKNININIPLKKNIVLKDILQENNINIDLTTYFIKENKNYDIIYSTLNSQIVSVEEENSFYVAEIFQKENDGFNKLAKCNIDDINLLGIGDPNDLDNFYSISKNDYQLLPDQGIIVWNKNAGTKYDYDNIYILYTIKKPVGLILKDNFIYDYLDKTNNNQINLNGYKLIDTIKDIIITPDNLFYSMANYPDFYNPETKTIVVCENPNYNAKKVEDGILFYKVYDQDALFVHSGYYYINNQEYYLLSNSTNNEIEESLDINYYNINKKTNVLEFNKSAQNYINNSLLETDNSSEIYNKNFRKDNMIKGISSLNHLTACNTMDSWITTNLNINLVNGINDTALQFSNTDEGYAYLDITDSLYDTNVISLYCLGTAKIYLAKEKYIDGLRFRNAKNIVIEKEFENDNVLENIKKVIFDKEPDHNYYIVIKTKQTVIDDIIVLNKEYYNRNVNYHIKNIDLLNLKLDEQNYDNKYTSRLYFTTNTYKNYGAEIDQDNNIKTSPTVSWGLTKIKSYTDYEDWSFCKQFYLANENNTLISKDKIGSITTEPILIGDTDIIKDIIIKVNDIEYDRLTGLNIILYGCNQYDGIYNQIAQTQDNVLHLQVRNSLIKKCNYIKVKIDVPIGKILDNLSVYVGYKTTDDKAPLEKINSSGYLISEIFDTHYEKKFKLSDIKINSISNIYNVELQIRAAKTNVIQNIWTDWKSIKLSPDGKLLSKDYVFDGYRYFQMKIIIKNKKDYININYIELKEVE